VSLPLSGIVEIAEAAGRLILRHYASKQVEKQLKEDQSPLTAADIASHDLIVRELEASSPWPVLSEESAEASYENRRAWQRFWLVDPLDGTREFLKRNGEFTVNIALIDHGLPVMGVVHAPARALTYFAARGQGAFLKERACKAKRIARGQPGCERLAVVVSRSHADAQTAAFLATLGEYESVSVGSSLKFCLLAEGRAQLYPRFGPTMEWDTAAGQCVLEEAGGSVCDLERRPLTYNKRDLRNPFFIARASSLREPSSKGRTAEIGL
jgi:3'(2'), 5'-bisphosphate nucleotidase